MSINFSNYLRSGTLTVAAGGTGTTTSTGTGSVVLSNSPTITNPYFTTNYAVDASTFDDQPIFVASNSTNIAGLSYAPLDNRVLVVGISPNKRVMIRTGSDTIIELRSSAVSVASTTTSTTSTSGALQVAGGVGIAENLFVGGTINTSTTAVSAAAWTTSGVNLKLLARTYTDTSSTAGTVSSSYINTISAPTFASTNAITITDAANLFVAAPIAGTNSTLTNAYAIYANGKIKATAFIGDATGLSTTASSTSTVTSSIAISTGANSVTGLSYYNTATGSITISSGSTTSGMSGGVNINSGNAGMSGTITLKPGISTDFAGSVNISGGNLNSATSSYGGNVNIYGGAGLGGSSGSYGGNLLLYGGNPEGSPVTSTGGHIYMFGGAAAQNATGVKTNGNILIGDQTTNIISIASATVAPNIGSSSSAKIINIGTSTSTTTINGNLIVNGTTTTINSSTLSIDDKNIELGSVVAATISATGTIGSITGTGPWTATITNMTTTAGLLVGSSITATSGTGTLYGGSPSSVLVASIVSNTSITYTVTGGTTPTAGTVTNIYTSGNNDITAHGAGITIKATADKTLYWTFSEDRWISNIGFQTSQTTLANTVGTQQIAARFFSTFGGNGGGIDISHFRDSTGSVGTNGTGTLGDWMTAGTRLQQKIDATWMAWQQFNGTGNPYGIAWGTGGSTSNPQSVPEMMRLDQYGNLKVTSVGGTFGGMSLRNNYGSAATTSVGYLDFQNENGVQTGHLFVNHETDGSSTMLLATTPVGARTSDRRVSRLIINGSGNVGIGVFPTSRLHVANTVTGGDVAITVQNLTTSASSTTTVSLNDNVGDLVKLIGDNAGSIASLRATNRNTSLSFWTGTAGGAERMRIDSSGNVGIGGAPFAGVAFRILKTLTGTTTAYAQYIDSAIQTDVTSAYLINTGPTQIAGGALSNLTHIYLEQGTLSGTVTHQYGFRTASSLTGAVNNFGFYGGINASAGTNRYNLYMAGTADNYINGNLLLNAPQRFSGAGGSWFWIDNVNTTTLRFSSGASAGTAGPMYFTDSGNLGIGVAPTSKLHVRSDANALTVIGQLQNRTSGANTGATLAFITSANDISDNRYAYIGAVTTGAGQNGNSLVFASNANGSAPTENMRIDSAGNVGIGHAAPSSWYSYSPRLLVNNAQNAETIIGIGNTTSGASAACTLRYIGGTANSHATSSLVDGSASPYFLDDCGSGVLYRKWTFGGAERMRLSWDGSLTVSKGALVLGDASVSTGSVNIEMGNGRTGDGYAYIDLHTSAGTDYNLRLIHDPGINGGSALTATGTGGLVIRTEGAAPLSFTTNNTTRLTIDSSGIVGVGTGSIVTSSAPSIQLQSGVVVSSVTGAQITLGSNIVYNSAWKYATTASAAYYQLYNGAHYWNTAPSGTAGTTATFTESMRIDSAGNVGIGTTAPVAKLHVSGTILSGILAAPNFVLNSPGSNYGFIQNDSANTWSLSSGISPSTSGTPVLTWNSSGNVGIGTTSPYAKLHVYSAADTSQLIQDANSVLRIITSTGKNYIQSGTAYSNASAAPLIFTDIYAINEWMRITAAGNVGIGTGATVNYKLQVNGSFAATTKSFVIDHPTKPDMKLRYGSLESPYHGVRLTGEGVLVNGNATIELPDYIHGLCKQEGSQVQITNIKHGKVIWVEDIEVDNNKFTVAADVNDDKEYKFYWSFTAIRKDIEDMVVEF